MYQKIMPKAGMKELNLIIKDMDMEHSIIVKVGST